MLMKVAFLMLLSRFPNKISSHTCIPNSHVYLNEKLCLCDKNGRWADMYCSRIIRRQLAMAVCRPGHVTVQGCTRCVCRADGQYACDERGCGHSSAREDLIKALPLCNPFRTYYINCNICICPASGETSDARCAFDISCSFTTDPTTTEITTRKTMCFPKVMYLFSCLHCLCSDDGYFTMKKCVVTCAQNKSDITSRRCIAKTLYKKGCNICFCPDSGIPDDTHCTNTTCDNLKSFNLLRTLKDKHLKCVPHEFTKPRCVYCDCNQDGGIDESTCLDLECLRNEDLKYEISKEICNPGEMVPFCMECLCTRSGVTSDEYCSKACSYQSKLKVLDRIISMPNIKSIIDMETISKKSESEKCAAKSIYIEKDRICICPDIGITNFNMCTTAIVTRIHTTSGSPLIIDFNTTCEPSTFVEFDCNTCFCTKSGKIDPKWCTYDNCEAKRIIQKSHNMHNKEPESNSDDEYSVTCGPGSITNVDCNFCICPDSGLKEDRVCTRNNCSGFAIKASKEKFSCEPLAYYEIDCNICYCPKDGVKNISKCTKNHCDKRMLRSDACAPGQLFSEECNVCVCPPDGNKEERACTNYSCADTAPWYKIHQLSETLLGHQVAENDITRHLDLCFPGEEFVVGCKICVCPDVGLKMYSTCSPSFCEEGSALKIPKTKDINYKSNNQNNSGNVMYIKLETRRESCTTLNYSVMFSRQKCTPGSMYIVKCKQCICPYAGGIEHYCRQLPKDYYCEQAYPRQNFLPMGRRRQKEKIGNASNAMMSDPSPGEGDAGDAGGAVVAGGEGVLHEHTRYRCHSRGNVTDDCFRCECDGSTIIEQHCFQNTAKYCEGLKPSFLRDDTETNHSIIDFT